MTAGEHLRTIRERLGLTIRDVEAATTRLAEKYQNQEFAVTLSRLSDIETKGVTPSIFKLYALAATYRRDLDQFLEFYGLSPNQLAEDAQVAAIPRTHLATAGEGAAVVEMPVQLDPGFDPRTTFLVGRMIQTWGTVPLGALKRFTDRKFSYGYIGTEDLTMYPLLMPGSFVQIDERLNKVQDGGWRSEYERPIYMVETREGYVCAWCEVSATMLTLRSHPLSPVKSRSLRLGSEAEIVGQVVGMAMRLGLSNSSEGK